VSNGAVGQELVIHYVENYLMVHASGSDLKGLMPVRVPPSIPVGPRPEPPSLIIEGDEGIHLEDKAVIDVELSLERLQRQDAACLDRYHGCH